jgi:hypothetical protein
VIVRTVLAVALAAALVAVSQPAVESAGRERTAAAVADEVDRFVEQATSLVDTDDAVARPGARRIVTVSLPEPGQTAAGIGELAFEPAVEGQRRSAGTTASAISWRIDGGDRNRRFLERITLETSDDEPLVLGEHGRHRLVLSLRGSNADPRVHLRRYGTGGEADG